MRKWRRCSVRCTSRGTWEYEGRETRETTPTRESPLIILPPLSSPFNDSDPLNGDEGRRSLIPRPFFFFLVPRTSSSLVQAPQRSMAPLPHPLSGVGPRSSNPSLRQPLEAAAPTPRPSLQFRRAVRLI